MMTKGSSQHDPGRCRVWLFRLAALTLVPVALLLLLELGLRVGGAGDDPAFFVRIDGRDSYTTNQRFGWRFVPPSLARSPLPCEIARRKAPGVYRIFVFGGSAAQGMPDQAFAIGRVLMVMLEQAYPERRFEIINTAMTAMNSHVVRDIARYCGRFEPDLFVVYMGNNEVVGPYGPGTVFTGSLYNLTAIRMSIAARRLRIAQLMDRLIGMLQPKRVWRGMNMFVDRRVFPDDPQLVRTYKHFRANLIDVCDVARQAGAGVVLCTLATNLKDCPPFASAHRTDLTPTDLAHWQTLFQRAMKAEQGDRYEEAIRSYRRAAQIDDQYAEMCFRLGRLYLKMGKREAARRWLIRARDLDLLRFRADSRINDVIRQVGRGDVHLVDVEKALDDQSEIAGFQWLHEHVHLNFAGNYQIALAMMPSIQALLGGPEAPLPGLTQCAEALALTDFHQWQFEKKMIYMTEMAPFTYQIGHKQDQARRKAKTEALKPEVGRAEVRQRILDQCKAALERRPDDLELRRVFATVLGALNELDQAQQQWQWLLQRLPHWAAGQGELAQVLVRRGDIEQAIDTFRSALRTTPVQSGLAAHLGGALMEGGRLDEAEQCLRRVLKTDPDHAVALDNYGRLLAQQGRLDDPGLLFKLGLLKFRKGDRSQAIEHFEAALKNDPQHGPAREWLEALQQ